MNLREKIRKKQKESTPGLNLLKCPECEKDYTTKETLAIHLTNQHGYDKNVEIAEPIDWLKVRI